MKSSPDSIQFEIIIGSDIERNWILNDNSYLYRHNIDWRWRHSKWESFFVGSESFRDWFWKKKWFGSRLPLKLVQYLTGELLMIWLMDQSEWSVYLCICLGDICSKFPSVDKFYRCYQLVFHQRVHIPR